MSEAFKKFVAAVAADQGVNPNEVALQCIAVAMRLPTSAKYLTGAVPDSTIFPVPDFAALTDEIEALKAENAALKSTPSSEVPVNTTEIDTIQAENAALTAEVEALKAENAALKSTGKAPKAPKTPKTPKTESGEKKERNVGRKLISVSGLDSDAPSTDFSWRSLVVALAARAVAEGKKGDLPGNYFRDEPSKLTATLGTGEYVFAAFTSTEAEKRVRAIAKVLGLSITLKVTEPDGTEVDVITA